MSADKKEQTVSVGSSNGSGLPRRRVVLELKIGADSRERMLEALDEIASGLRNETMWGDCLTAAHSFGFTVSATEDESVTHDSYFAAIEAMLSQNTKFRNGEDVRPPSPSVSSVPAHVENREASGGVGSGGSSARDRIALALALEFYRGEYREKTGNPHWLKHYTAGMTVGSVIAAKYAEEEAQRCATMFWMYWKPDADALSPNKEGQPRAGEMPAGSSAL